MAMTANEAIAALSDSKYSSMEGLLELTAKVSATVDGAPPNATTLLYSGGLEPTGTGGTYPHGEGVQCFEVAQAISANNNEVITIDKTEVGKFLNSDEYKYAAERVTGGDPAKLELLRNGGLDAAGNRVPGVWDIASESRTLGVYHSNCVAHLSQLLW